MRSGVLLTVGLGVLVTVAACSGGASSSSTTTVSAQTINGQQVLVDGAGAALYTNDQDGSSLKCVSSDCNAIWAPLTAPGGAQPTAGPGVAGTLATVRRPDGKDQVTLDGKPLYTFSFDHGAGRVTGNGAADSFGGLSFTWHAALASGQAPAPGGSGGGGY
jgi:predicted lipoprotein with Yx(FWY)xxD motif